MLMLSRVGVACAHAIFWSIVTPLAVRVAPEGKRSLALSLIITGSSVAMIVGLPLGRAIGLMVGWRTTFLIIAALSAIIFMFLAVALPKMPSDNDVSFKSLPTLLKSPALRCIYVLTIVAITGHYTAYSYIEPFLGQIAGLSDGWITMVLSAFGVVGVIGSWFFSRYYDRHNLAFIRFALLGICTFVLLLRPAAFNPACIIIVCILWGLAINSYNLAFQSESSRSRLTAQLSQCPSTQAYTMSASVQEPSSEEQSAPMRRSFSGLCRRYNRRRRRVLLPHEVHPGIDNAFE